MRAEGDEPRSRGDAEMMPIICSVFPRLRGLAVHEPGGFVAALPSPLET
jgi:hypothetical protein